MLQKKNFNKARNALDDSVLIAEKKNDLYEAGVLAMITAHNGSSKGKKGMQRIIKMLQAKGDDASKAWASELQGSLAGVK